MSDASTFSPRDAVLDLFDRARAAHHDVTINAPHRRHPHYTISISEHPRETPDATRKSAETLTLEGTEVQP